MRFALVLALLALPSGVAQRTVTFAARANLASVGVEASLYEPLVVAGDLTLAAIVTGQARLEDPFGAARAGGGVVAGFGLQSCGPGSCWSADLRYRVLLTVGAPLDHGPDFTFALTVGLTDPPPEEPAPPRPPEVPP